MLRWLSVSVQREHSVHAAQQLVWEKSSTETEGEWFDGVLRRSARKLILCIYFFVTWIHSEDRPHEISDQKCTFCLLFAAKPSIETISSDEKQVFEQYHTISSL